jgi:hypothetical protein
MGDLRNINPPICYEPKTDTVHISNSAAPEVKVRAMAFALGGNKTRKPESPLLEALDGAGICKPGEAAGSSIHFQAKPNGLTFTP